MRPNIAGVPFIPSSMKPRLPEGSSRRVTSGPARKISAGKASLVLTEPSRYKTFEELNECEYGDRCLFAHSVFELKPLPFRHPKFRTERCLAFNDDGFCSFGPRCSFIHDKVDTHKVLMEILADVRKKIEADDERRLPVFQKICAGDHD